MPGVERKGDIASCITHTNTGSTTVFANSEGITKVGEDSAGGIILGPGSQTVFVEGLKVSLPGDLITAHATCGSPGGTPHCAATTENPSTDVFAGTGWADVPKIDLVLDAFGLAGPHLTNTRAFYGYFGGGFWLCTLYVGDITFSYTITNNSSVPAGPFNIGLWNLPYNMIGTTVPLIRSSAGSFDGTFPILQSETRQETIPAGGKVSGNIVLPSNPNLWTPDVGGGTDVPYDLAQELMNTTKDYERAFSLYLDLDLEVSEEDELNTLPTLAVEATYNGDTDGTCKP